MYLPKISHLIMIFAFYYYDSDTAKKTTYLKSINKN